LIISRKKSINLPLLSLRISHLHCDSHELKKPTSNKDQSYEKIEVGGIFVDGPAVILINQQYIKIVE